MHLLILEQRYGGKFHFLVSLYFKPFIDKENSTPNIILSSLYQLKDMGSLLVLFVCIVIPGTGMCRGFVFANGLNYGKISVIPFFFPLYSHYYLLLLRANL